MTQQQSYPGDEDGKLRQGCPSQVLNSKRLYLHPGFTTAIEYVT